MVGQTRADLIARIGALTTPKVTEGQAAIDFNSAANNFLSGMNQGKKLSDFVKENNAKNAYLEALETGDQNAIDKAYASYDPMGYAKMVRDREASDLQYERNKELADIAFQRSMQLEGMRNANARSLAELKAGLTGANTPNAIQVVNAMVESGIPLKDAWALYYAGQNPNVPTEIFGKKGGEKASEALGKNYAADMEEYNNMMSKMPELEDTVKQLNELGKTATYTTAGRVVDAFRKEAKLPARQSAIDRAEYVAMIDNQILPLLRDTFGAQFTEREGNTLRKTLGDANATPEEKAAQLNAFIRQKRKSIESKQRKIQAYTQPSLAQFQTPVEQTSVDYKSKYGLE